MTFSNLLLISIFLVSINISNELKILSGNLNWLRSCQTILYIDQVKWWEVVNTQYLKKKWKKGIRFTPNIDVYTYLRIVLLWWAQLVICIQCHTFIDLKLHVIIVVRIHFRANNNYGESMHKRKKRMRSSNFVVRPVGT